MMAYVNDREQEFVETATMLSDQAARKASAEQHHELEKAEARMGELDILFRKLYEDVCCKG